MKCKNLSKISIVFMLVLVSMSFISARTLVLEEKSILEESIIKAPTANAYLNIKVFLEGAMDGTNSMATTLRNDNQEKSQTGLGILPKTDPYLGTVTVTNLPSNTIDWVLVEIYNQKTGSLVLQTPAILLTDGSITETTGTSGIDITSLISKSNKYYIVVRHRNHLAVCSRSTTFFKDPITYYFDFTAGTAYENSIGQKEITTGVYAMIAGDGDGNEYVQTNDKVDIWTKEVGKYGYLQSDFNMDAYSQTTDKSGFWSKNVGKASQVNYLSDISAAFQANTHLITLESSSLPKFTNKINPFLKK